MQFAADPAGQKRLAATIFAVTDNRVPDPGSMNADLVGAAGHRLKFQPDRAVARPFDRPVFGLGGQPSFLINVHFLAARSGLLGEWRVNDAVLGRRHPGHQRPIGLARRPAGKGFGEKCRRACGPRQQQNARGVLVEPVHQFRATGPVEDQRIEQTVDMFGGRGAALRRQPRRLVDHNGLRVAVDHQTLGKGNLVFAQRRARSVHRHPRDCSGGRRFFRWQAQYLPLGHPVSRISPFTVDPELPSPGPARHQIEADRRHIPLEPAVEPDPVIIGGHGEFTAHGKLRASAIPAHNMMTDPATEETA